ncbi:MAG: hypothetical protein QXQ29_05700 [Candidatus Bathyarchaeia archaeon]
MPLKSSSIAKPISNAGETTLTGSLTPTKADLRLSREESRELKEILAFDKGDLYCRCGAVYHVYHEGGEVKWRRLERSYRLNLLR